MRKKELACQAWKDICKNCEKEEYFAEVFTAARKKHYHM